MSWVATAIVGSSAVSYIGGRQASRDADRRADQANAVTQDQLEFNKDVYADQLEFQLLDRERYDERYAKLESIFGPIEENLGNFYNSLTPETFIAAGIHEVNESFTQARQTFNTALAQKKLSKSGMAVAGMKDIAMEEAKAKAGIRREAPFKVAEAKQSFLQSRGSAGQPPGPVDTSGVNNSYANMATALTNQSNNAANAANSMYSSAGNLLMTGLMYGAQTGAFGATSGGQALPDATYLNENINNFQGNMTPEAFGPQ